MYQSIKLRNVWISYIVIQKFSIHCCNLGLTFLVLDKLQKCRPFPTRRLQCKFPVYQVTTNYLMIFPFCILKTQPNILSRERDIIVC